MLQEVTGIISGSTETDPVGILSGNLSCKCQSICFSSAPKLLKVGACVYENSYNIDLNHTIYTEFMGTVFFTQLSLVTGEMGGCPDSKGVLSVLMNLNDFSLTYNGC